LSKWHKGTGARALHGNVENLELTACGILLTLDNMLKGLQKLLELLQKVIFFVSFAILCLKKVSRLCTKVFSGRLGLF
jgi:hypothetical protein